MSHAESSYWLYERWAATAQSHSREIALVEFASRRQWTFHELFAQTEHPGRRTRIAFPSGHNAEFVLALLQAWRCGTPVCPLESGQAAPDLWDVPAGFAHLKLTSATTGAAKCIAFTSRQLAAD